MKLFSSIKVLIISGAWAIIFIALLHSYKIYSDVVSLSIFKRVINGFYFLAINS